VFAPTNDAWIKRLPTLTRANNIDIQELFSESKSAALQNMLQYTFLNQLTKVPPPFPPATQSGQSWQGMKVFLGWRSSLHK